MRSDPIFWLLRGAQFLPMADQADPAHERFIREQQLNSQAVAHRAHAGRSVRRRVARYLGML